MNLNMKKRNSWNVAGRLASMLVLLSAATGFSVETGGVHVQKLYVDGASGSDKHDGRSREAALKTIQAAADRVRPGDEVIIYPGVYNERSCAVGLFQRRVRVDRFPGGCRCRRPRGSDQLPTRRFAAAQTGSWRMRRWGFIPSRTPGRSRAGLLYDGVDLYPYPARSNLETFTTTDTRDGEGNNPGPRHGWFYRCSGKRNCMSGCMRPDNTVRWIPAIM